MPSLFKSTLNTRYLPIKEKKVIRSDCPLQITPEEIQFLKDNDIKTIIDLRGSEEYTRMPCFLEKEEGFTYLHLTVTGGNMPKSKEELIPCYLEMVDAQMDKILDTILNAPSGVMYFCSSGKDRSGMVSLMLLKKLGYDEQTIIDDYMASKENLRPMFDAIRKQYPNFDLSILIPDEEIIRKVLLALK